VVSKSTWDKVAESDRELIRKLASETETKLLAEIPKREEEAVAEMRTRGLQVAKEPAGDAAKWLSLGTEFQKRFRTHSVPPEIFDQAVKLLEEHRKAR